MSQTAPQNIVSPLLQMIHPFFSVRPTQPKKGIQLLHGDCLEVMKTLPDKSIDLFICDLPYGCLTGGGRAEKTRRRFKDGKDTDGLIKQVTGVITGCAWDIKIDLVAFWIQVERLMKNDHTPIIQFCTTRFGNELMNSKPSWFRYDLVWKKSNAVGFLSANKQPLRDHENIYVFAKKGANYNRIDMDVEGAREWKQFGVPEASGVYGLIRDKPVVKPVGAITSVAGKRCVKSVIEIASQKGRKQHPTQKPDDLYEWLITRYSKLGDTILDPTAGSFTSCFTAKRLERNAIGIEMDKTYFNKAVHLETVLNASP